MLPSTMLFLSSLKSEGALFGGGAAPNNAPSLFNELRNNIVDGSITQGMYIFKSNSNVAEGNIVTGSGGNGIIIVSANDSSILNNASYGNAGNGILVSSTAPLPANNTFTGNTAFSNNSSSTVSDLFDGTSPGGG